MVLNKHEIESALHAEHQEITAGRLKEDNPLDQSEGFKTLCEGCRRGDLRVCQEQIQEGVNINARDTFDYTPLILVSPAKTPTVNYAETSSHRQVSAVISRSFRFCSSLVLSASAIPFKANDVFTML